MKLIKKEDIGNFVHLTFQDNSGDLFTEVITATLWENISEVRKTSWRQLENAIRRDERHNLREYIDGVSESEIANYAPSSVNERIEETEFLRRAYQALEILTEQQKRRLLAYCKGLSYQEIAEMEGVRKQSIYESIQLAVRKIKKFTK